MTEQGKRASIDGFPWNEAQDIEMDRICATVLARPDGQQLLAYLKRITVNNVQGPGVTNEQLRHLEGQRCLVAIMEGRMAAWQARMERQTKEANKEKEEGEEKPTASKRPPRKPRSKK